MFPNCVSLKVLSFKSREKLWDPGTNNFIPRAVQQSRTYCISVFLETILFKREKASARASTDCFFHFFTFPKKNPFCQFYPQTFYRSFFPLFHFSPPKNPFCQFYPQTFYRSFFPLFPKKIVNSTTDNNTLNLIQIQ